MQLVVPVVQVEGNLSKCGIFRAVKNQYTCYRQLLILADKPCLHVRAPNLLASKCSLPGSFSPSNSIALSSFVIMCLKTTPDTTHRA